jgi:dTMP kinase
MQAKFIVVEGIEGAGKSTAITHIKELLTANNIDYILTREPGGTAVAEDIRNIIKRKYEGEIIYGETEVLLLYAARLQLVNNVIKPALAANKWVIADRHDLSTIAYQVGGRGLAQDFITGIKQNILGDFSYDFCLYLDIEPKLGLQRAFNRSALDRIEQENISFFERVRSKYLELAKVDSKIVTIDASKSKQEVKTNVLAALKYQYELL